MANEAPVYTQKLDVPDAPSATIQPLNNPLPDRGAMFGAMSTAAREVQQFAIKQKAAADETTVATARADFLTRLHQAQETAVQSPDYENAPKDFEATRAQLQGDALKGIADEKLRAETGLHLTVAGLSAQSKVNAAALTKQTSVASGALDTSLQDLQLRAAQAGSPIEQQSLRDVAHQTIDSAVAAGTIDAAQGAGKKRLWEHGLSTADVARTIAADPGRALAALDDPAAFPALTPFERETLKQQARAAHDEQARLRADDLAKRDPAMAAAQYGVVTSRAHADQLFDRVIVPIESGGNPKAVSSAGAIGLGQLMPATARDVAGRLGLKDVAALDDGSLRERLKEPELNRALGTAYWAEQLKRYNGNVYAAAAAYNAGPGNADKPRADAWDAAAREKFGDHYSAAQLASLITIAETRDYVLKVAQRLGADPTAPPLSFRGSYGVASAVTQQLQHQQNEIRQQDNALISLSQPDRDSIAEAFRKGYEMNPLAVQAAKQPLIDAAARGNLDATVKLRQFEEAQATYPIVQELYRHTPEQVEAVTAHLRAQAASGDATPDTMRRLDLATKVSAEMAEARRSNPIGLAERQMGPQSVTAVGVPQDPSDPGFANVLGARSVMAAQANAQYGGEMKFFKPQEAAALKPWFAQQPPEGQAAVIGALAKATGGGRTFEAAINEITDGKPATKYAAGLYGVAPDIAASIVAGAGAVDTYVPSKGPNAASYQTEKKAALPLEAFNKASRLAPEGAFKSMGDAIDARYAYLSAQAHDDSGKVDTTRLRQAANDVTGGILSFNGAKLIAPFRGATQKDFDGALWSLTDDDLKGMQTGGGKAVGADYLRASTKLHAFGDGTYLVQLNRDDDKPQYAAGPGGAPYVLDLRNRKAKPQVRDAEQDQAAALAATGTGL